MELQIFLLLALVSLSIGHEGHDHHQHDKVKPAFIEHQIIPDVLSAAPEHLLEVSYPKSGKVANLGNELTPTDVREQPDIKYDANPEDYYTLILTDPDAPSRANPTRREFRHWTRVNIPGNDVSKGEELTGYVGSGPPKGSGAHRYIFLLYKQPAKINFEEKVVSDHEVGDRPLFSTKKFAEKYNLELKAGNFYQAQYDDSVPAVHKQLGIAPPPAKE